MADNSRSASEKSIEDVFAKYPAITESTLNYKPNSLTLLDRQQSVEVGRTDLLFLSGNKLLLIELKAESATEDHVMQLEEYRNHYQQEELGDRYPSSLTLVPILLAPEIPNNVKAACDSRGLVHIKYDIGDVLAQFENRLFSDHGMFEQEPVSTGVAQLHYINGLIRYLGEESKSKTRDDCIEDLDRIAKRPNWESPTSRMGQFIRLGIRLNIIYRAGKSQPLSRQGQLRVLKDDELLLTERGLAYYKALSDGPERVPRLNAEQADILKKLLYERPYYSKVTAGIVVFLDTVYDLSKASNRVRTNDLEQWFPKKAGRAWSGKSPASLVTWYGNYLDELGLINKATGGSKSQRQYHYLTPEGVRLLSNLHIEIGKILTQSQT